MKNKLGLGLMVLGILSVLSSAGLLLYNTWDDRRAAEASWQTVQILQEKISHNDMDIVQNDVTRQFAESETFGELLGININGEQYMGILSISSLSLQLPIYSTWSYPQLKNAPCRYAGDLYDDTLVIAAHNYKQHFGNISSLVYGDAVSIHDANGIVHRFLVADIYTADSTDIQGVVQNEYDLTLFTCTYRSEARVVIRCVRD